MVDERAEEELWLMMDLTGDLCGGGHHPHLDESTFVCGEEDLSRQ